LFYVIRKRVTGRAQPADRHPVQMPPFNLFPDVFPHPVRVPGCAAAGQGTVPEYAVKMESAGQVTP